MQALLQKEIADDNPFQKISGKRNKTYLACRQFPRRQAGNDVDVVTARALSSSLRSGIPSLEERHSNNGMDLS
jgi:hypothetical protein